MKQKFEGKKKAKCVLIKSGKTNFVSIFIIFALIGASSSPPPAPLYPASPINKHSSSGTISINGKENIKSNLSAGGATNRRRGVWLSDLDESSVCDLLFERLRSHKFISCAHRSVGSRMAAQSE